MSLRGNRLLTVLLLTTEVEDKSGQPGEAVVVLLVAGLNMSLLPYQMAQNCVLITRIISVMTRRIPDGAGEPMY